MQRPSPRFRSEDPYTRYPKKCSTQIYRELYGDAMLVLIRSTNMADGSRQKHLLPSFDTKP